MAEARLLLRVLRGDDVDWEEAQRAHMPSTRCSRCEALQLKTSFAVWEWSRTDGLHYCKTCIWILSDHGRLQECTGGCKQWVPADKFAAEQWNRRSERFCDDCVERRCCQGVCGLRLPASAFAPGEWFKLGNGGSGKSRRGVCRACMRRNQGLKPCSVCGHKFAKEAFSGRMWDQADARRKCVEDPSDLKLCSGPCGRRLPKENHFSDREWRQVIRKCQQCRSKRRGFWRCIGCKHENKVVSHGRVAVVVFPWKCYGCRFSWECYGCPFPMGVLRLPFSHGSVTVALFPWECYGCPFPMDVLRTHRL